MKKLYTVLVVVIAASLLLAACGGTGGGGKDLLGAIKARGYILVSTDPNYEPQSFLNTNGKRPANTKCPADALTTAEMQGFDVDVAKAIGDDLGVETCFATPDWALITAGNWADKWDISVGSMTIYKSRQKVLDFSVPYYYTPAVVAVLKDSGFTSLDNLAGKAICAGTSTTYADWIEGKSDIPAENILVQPPAGVTVVTLDTDQECAQALASGRKDFVAYATSATVVDANIAAGMPVMKLGGTIYIENLAAAFDKSSTLNTDSLRAEVDKLFTAMHSDGRLTALSNQWFKMDLTQAPNK
ncbi:MAG: transporter substrate-binding domain-containing protein [Chloroflexi bacterium]|nr:transporter substrate-binding domain-containing protein [Chloroflexota bacterium]